MSGGASERTEGYQLTLAQAVPLGTVTLQTLLGRSGIRSMAIKGPAFVALEVRAPRHSNDIDLIVDPARFDDAKHILDRAGWKPWLDGLPDDSHMVHSTTLAHPLWPCTFDAHQRFPGILAPPQEAFEVLWRARAEVSLAHQRVTTVSRPAALIIELLHVLRGAEPSMPGPLSSAFVNALPTPITADERAALTQLIPDLGAAHSLAPAFEVLELTGVATRSEDAELRHEWERFERFGAHGSGWIAALHWRHPARSARDLFHYAWISDEAARRWAGSQGVRYRGRLPLLVTRVRRGARALLRSQGRRS